MRKHDPMCPPRSGLFYTPDHCPDCESITAVRKDEREKAGDLVQSELEHQTYCFIHTKDLRCTCGLNEVIIRLRGYL